jgi:hypothetical protein
MSQRKALLLVLIGLFLVPITVLAGPIQVNIAFTRASVYDSWLCARGNLTAKWLASIQASLPSSPAPTTNFSLAAVPLMPSRPTLHLRQNRPPSCCWEPVSSLSDLSCGINIFSDKSKALNRMPPSASHDRDRGSQPQGL